MNAGAAPDLNRMDGSLLRRAQWRMMDHALRWSIGANLAAGGILAATLYWSFGVAEALVWLAAIIVLTGVRAALLFRFIRPAVVSRAPGRARVALLGGLLASGLIWGLGAVWLMQPDDFISQVLICFFAAGMTAGGAASISAVPLGFELFATPLLSLVVGRLATIDAGPSYFMTAAVVVFALIMFGVAATSRRQVESALALWLANRRLRLDLVRARSRELTARRRADDLSQAKQAAEDAAESKSMFLAAVSHELRTPLNAVIGFSEMIANEFYGSLGDERYREYAEDIRTSGVHLRSLIDDLLDLSRLQYGRARLDLAEVDIGEVCAEVVREFAMSDMKLGGRLTIDVAPEGLSLRADRKLIYQIVRNLCENAVKFAFPETEIRIECNVVDGDFVRVRVSDRGEGIPEETLQSIMEPFVQAAGEDRARADGVGLGLTLVREFVALHDGVLEIRNVENVGVTVDVRLPKGGPRSDQPPTPQPLADPPHQEG